MSSHGGNKKHLNLVVVAVDKDKNSGHAFHWAINNIDNPILIAIHVKHKDIPHSEGTTNVFRPDEDDVANIFEPLREMCNDKVVKMKEAVIKDSDISKGILEYVQRNHIQIIVVGAPSSSAKNASARFYPLNSLSKSINMRFGSKKFKGYDDVPTTLIKAAPVYTSVYVISKEKVVENRPAIFPSENMVIEPKQPLQLFASKSQNGVRTQPFGRGSTSGRSGRSILPRSSLGCESMRSVDLFNQGQRSSLSHNSSTRENNSQGSHKFGSLVVTKQDPDLSVTSVSHSLGDVEAEIEKLRLQLKQTMEMYNSACKEAISAQNKAKEINQWKLEEEPIVKEVMLSKERALAMAEEEKAKAQVALKEAEEAMKKAEMEAKRRLQAEMLAKKEVEEKDKVLTMLVENDVRFRKYTIEEIENATQKFSPSMKVGQGGYGPVFKGQLDHTPVAIKILNPDASQGRKQFHQEVEVLCNIRHPNMVLLLGACVEYGCLVYEYMDNGSLEDRLLRKHNSPPIPWRKRFEIAYEIATALLFLHQTKPEPIVHRDLKPANILLDKNFVSKISDVGLARLIKQNHMTSAAGTLYYIDPEYQQTGMLTTKSDIYSLGIMLLQIITVKPPTGIAHHVKRAIEKGNFFDMLDPMVTDWPLEETLAFAKLSLSCAELSKNDRPDLALVVLPELKRLRDFAYSL